MKKTSKIVAAAMAAAFAILATGMAPASATAPGSQAKTVHITMKQGDTGWD